MSKFHNNTITISELSLACRRIVFMNVTWNYAWLQPSIVNDFRIRSTNKEKYLVFIIYFVSMKII